MFQKNKYFNKNKMYYFEGMIVRYLNETNICALCVLLVKLPMLLLGHKIA